MKFLIRGIMIFLLILLASCSRVNQTNFNKIHTGMQMKEVIAILGEPTTSDSVNIAGISGTSATWKDKQAVISIQFLDDKVQIKAYSNPVGNEP